MWVCWQAHAAAAVAERERQTAQDVGAEQAAALRAAAQERKEATAAVKCLEVRGASQWCRSAAAAALGWWGFGIVHARAMHCKPCHASWASPPWKLGCCSKAGPV